MPVCTQVPVYIIFHRRMLYESECSCVVKSCLLLGIRGRHHYLLCSAELFFVSVQSLSLVLEVLKCWFFLKSAIIFRSTQSGWQDVTVRLNVTCIFQVHEPAILCTPLYIYVHSLCCNKWLIWYICLPICPVWSVIIVCVYVCVCWFALKTSSIDFAFQHSVHQ